MNLHIDSSSIKHGTQPKNVETITCWSKGLNCIKLALFHFCLFSSFHNWNRFSSMDLITSNTVPIQISDTLNWERATPNTLNVIHYMKFYHKMNTDYKYNKIQKWKNNKKKFLSWWLWHNTKYSLRTESSNQSWLET